MAADKSSDRRNSGGREAASSRRAVTRRRSRKPSRGGGRRLLILLVLALFVGGAFWAYRAGLLNRETLQRIPLPGVEPPKTRQVTLYFADPRWSRLVPELREIAVSRGTLETARMLVQALAEGSRQGLAGVLPADTKLRNVYLGRDGLLVLDFEPDLLSFDPGGASGEALTVFALVNSMGENLNEIKQVQLLVSGEEQETLAGHVKISEPLHPDPQWIKGEVGESGGD